MNKISRFAATAAVAALTVVGPVVLAAPTATAATAAPSVTERAPAISLSKEKEGTHYGLAGNKITAKVKGKGKVKFSVKGYKKSVKIKKGKAVFKLPATLTPGTYKVTAKFGKKKAKIKTPVWDSALNLTTAVFTIGLTQNTYDFPDNQLNGQVKFKGKVASKGYVDLYLNGNVKGGSGSPDYCCMATVGADGTFGFYNSSFLSDAQERGVGTHTYRAFYTDTASFADYIYSQPITVTVTP